MAHRKVPKADEAQRRACCIKRDGAFSNSDVPFAVLKIHVCSHFAFTPFNNLSAAFCMFCILRLRSAGVKSGICILAIMPGNSIVLTSLYVSALFIVSIPFSPLFQPIRAGLVLMFVSF
ncbi:MAG: hypothetical protein J6R95_02325 [Bacteroidales bacterium]|nr:hypothetical protein [Bacteroidales bacterium]